MGKLTVFNDNAEQFQMNVDKDTGEKYAACAYFWDEGDSVELVDF